MEIKFRGKRLDNGEWVYGDIIQLHDERRFIVNNKHGACIDNKGNFINTEAPFVCEVDPATVGQYTGKDDMAGTEIYTGCKLRRSDAQICTVRFNKNLLCYEAISEDGGYIPVNQWDKSEVIPC